MQLESGAFYTIKWQRFLTVALVTRCRFHTCRCLVRSSVNSRKLLYVDGKTVGVLFLIGNLLFQPILSQLKGGVAVTWYHANTLLAGQLLLAVGRHLFCLSNCRHLLVKLPCIKTFHIGVRLMFFLHQSHDFDQHDQGMLCSINVFCRHCDDYDFCILYLMFFS